MPSLLDFLSGGVQAASVGVAAHDEGKRKGLLDLLAQQDADASRTRQQGLDDLNRRNIESMIAERDREKLVYDPTRGAVVDRGSNTATVPTGLPSRAAGSTPRIDPNSPEGIRAAAERARGVASARADVAAGAPGASARPTESQEKSMMFSRFINEATPVIEQLEGQVDGNRISAALSPLVETGERLTGPGAIGSRMLDDNEQLLINAARNFAAGVLRKESGAAITTSELRETFQRFIPLGGDSDAVKAQKRANRQMMQAAMNDLALPAEQYAARVRQFYSTAPQTTPTPRGPATITPPKGPAVSPELTAAMREFMQGGRP